MRRPGNDQATALLLALAGFFLMSVGDAVVKSMADEWPGTAIAALRYSLGALGLAAIVALRFGRRGFVFPRPRLQLARGASVALATVGFFMGVQFMPLADATAIQFTSPILTAFLSAAFLGERAPRSARVAIAVAFVGVLIVLRPNALAFGAAALFPIAAAIGMAGLMIFNRMAAGLAPIIVLQLIVAIMALPWLLVAAAVGGASGAPALAVDMPGWTVVARCAVIAVTATVGHWLIFRATELASAAVVAPMTYVQLVVAVGIGALAFGDWPDFATLGGAALIVGAGLLLWRAQRSRAAVATTD